MKINTFSVNKALEMMRDAVAKGRPADIAHTLTCLRIRMNKAERETVKRLYDEGKEHME